MRYTWMFKIKNEYMYTTHATQIHTAFVCIHWSKHETSITHCKSGVNTVLSWGNFITGQRMIIILHEYITFQSIHYSDYFFFHHVVLPSKRIFISVNKFVQLIMWQEFFFWKTNKASTGIWKKKPKTCKFVLHQKYMVYIPVMEHFPYAPFVC